MSNAHIERALAVGWRTDDVQSRVGQFWDLVERDHGVPQPDLEKNLGQRHNNCAETTLVLPPTTITNPTNSHDDPANQSPPASSDTA
jgi:hypothetical protein